MGRRKMLSVIKMQVYQLVSEMCISSAGIFGLHIVAEMLFISCSSDCTANSFFFFSA